MKQKITQGKLRAAFDLACKYAETGEKDVRSSEYYKNGRHYYAYQTKEEFEKFVEGMQQNYSLAHSGFVKGGGGELLEGKRPPKMASYASSSRMIYLLARKIDGFQFEAHRTTKIGGVANIDGYLSTSDNEIYVEAKCHEMFSRLNNSKIPKCYLKFYKEIYKDGVFSFDTYNNTFYGNGNPIRRFDLKQAICHMFGMAHYQLINEERSKKNVKFIYLTHSLSEKEKEFLQNRQGVDYVEGIQQILNEEEMDIKNIDFLWLYAKIVHYLYTYVQNSSMIYVNRSVMESLPSHFEFIQCNQENFVETIKRL